MKNGPVRLENLTQPNIRFYNDQHRFIVVSAGRRSRKTLIGDRKMLVDPKRGALNLSNHTYLFAAPTHQQAKRIYWTKLKKDTKLFQAKVSESELKITLLNGSELLVIGLDKPERIEGITDPPIKGIHITEFGNIKDKIWDNNIRPILADTEGFAIIDGVPEGKNHYYDIALYSAGGPLPETVPQVGAYAENPLDDEWSFHAWFSSDVLPEKEIIALKRSTDAKTFRQEYEASFEGEDGLAYYSYSIDNHNNCRYQKGMMLDIGMDFNVDPMCAVEGHLINGGYHQHGESILRNSNTMEMGQHLIEKYNLKHDANGKLNATVYPDATGKNTSTNASITDLQILLKLGFHIKARRSNPLQKDRINAMNSAMRPMIGNPRYFINLDNCPNTADDFQKVESLADGRLNKKQEEKGKPRVHITDALGYLIYYNFPIHAATRNTIRSA